MIDLRQFLTLDEMIGFDYDQEAREMQKMAEDAELYSMNRKQRRAYLAQKRKATK